MIRILALLTLLFISACSSFFSPRPQPMPVDARAPEIIAESNDPESGVVTVTRKEAKRFAVDKSKPASFAEYKQWRRENDPGGQVYAEFKQWEAALKERKLRQQNKAK